MLLQKTKDNLVFILSRLSAEFDPKFIDQLITQLELEEKTKVLTVTTATTITPDIDHYEMTTVSALGSAVTIGNPIGTPSNGDAYVVRIEDDGTSRAITFGSDYQAVGVTLPTATTISKLLYISFVYNASDSKWDVIAVNEEA